ncbi:MAG TPA: alkyl hydroperoxide reductase [Chitinophagaceae bacterium]|jgi:peroxiredoxin|nr:alkyl hydroperoxide reductase [Chitinophagaceae bacterium]
MGKLLFAAAAASLFCITSCHSNESSGSPVQKADSSFAIIGKVTGLDTGMIYIFHLQTGKTDSASLDHGFFQFRGKADSVEYCQLRLGEQHKGFFLENGKTAMLIKKDSLQNALISGTPVQDEYNDYQTLYSKPLTDRMSEVDKAYEAASKRKDTRTGDSLEKVFEKLDQEQKQQVVDYTQSHRSSIVSVFEIADIFSYDFRLGQLDSVYRMLDSSVRSTYFGRTIQNTIEKTKLTAVGNPAPDFSSKDVNGRTVSLASFRGKYVLLDFWASWCGPCRLENPNIVKAYHQFHDKGFDILGVSLDETRPEWLQAIKKDGLNWTQVSDLKGWQAEVVSQYGIKAIPMNFLLDKNGIIIARGLRGNDLGNKLAEQLR